MVKTVRISVKVHYAMKSMLLIFLCIIFFSSCDRQPSMPARTVQLDHADREIVLIAEAARDTLSIFFRHLSGTGAGEHSFYIKYPFDAKTDSGIISEQIWLSGISFRDGLYYGKLANTPLYLHGLKTGDTVAFSADSISDWMYIQNDKIIGGYSIKYLLESIPEDQRSEEQKKLLQMFEY